MTIKTVIDREDALELLKIGEQFMKESRFGNGTYNAEKVWTILDATLRYPDRYFIAYDSDFRGLILLMISEHYFSTDRFCSDLAFFVTPEARGSTLGPRLLKEGIKWAEGCGVKEFTIFHNAGFPLTKFYEGMGLPKVGEIFSKDM